MQSLLAYRSSVPIPQHFQRNISDGPSSEFKNQYMMKHLHHVIKQHSAKFTRDYFATDYVKGVVDRIGGEAKSMV